MNNVVLMFSPTDEKTPYERGGENRTQHSPGFIQILPNT